MPTRSPKLLSLATLLLLALTACGDGGTAGPQGSSGPALVQGPQTVVLVSIDTLRPDRLGVYGNTPDVSPRLDALATESVTFERALAPAPWTLPSHMSMLTGLDPVAHGVRNDGYGLSSHVQTLAEQLSDHGFETGAFTDGGFVSAKYGFDSGFDVYEDERTGRGPNGFRRSMPLALDWLDDRDADDDLFLFLHSFDAHAPYDNPETEILERFRARPTPDGPDDHFLHKAQYLHQQRKMGVTAYGRMSELLNDYDAGVHQADLGVGQLLDKLRALGRYENALIIVTSDHGESFFDHGLHVGHGLGVTSDELAIPMIVRFPEGRNGGLRRPDLVDLVDVAPTVLDTVGVAAVPQMQGDSLLGILEGKRQQRDFVLGLSTNTETYFIVRDDWKYISPVAIEPIEVARRHLWPECPPMGSWGRCKDYKAGKGTPEEVELAYDGVNDPLAIRDVLLTIESLYQLSKDPGEQRNVAGQMEDRRQNMLTFLLQAQEASAEVYNQLFDAEAKIGFTPHEQQQLRQLGYLAAPNAMAFRGLPKTMRDALTDRYEVPDMAPLFEADRAVHLVRMRLRDGDPIPKSTRRRLQEAGDAYVSWWLAAGEEYQLRAVWRLVALYQVSLEASVQLDWKDWLGQGLDFFGWVPPGERETGPAVVEETDGDSATGDGDGADDPGEDEGR